MWGTQVIRYVAFYRYNNLDKLYGKNAYRIEDEKRHYVCVNWILCTKASHTLNETCTLKTLYFG